MTSSSSSSAPPRRQCCFSFAAYARALMDHLRRSGVRVQPGLSDLELRSLESHLSFTFPPDLRAILQEGLPTTPPFPDWRSAPISSLLARLQHPLLELTSQVWNNKLWPEPWGIRPTSPEQAARVAGERLRAVPVLVPIYGNFFIPASESPGNPILLVQSGEVSIAGNDISDFFDKETIHPQPEEGVEPEEETQGSCLMGSSSKSSRSGEEKEKDKDNNKERERFWGRGLNPEAILLAFRRKKMFPRSIREIAGSKSAEVSPRPSVSSAHSGSIHQQQGHIFPDPPRRSLDVFPRRKNNRNKGAAATVALESLLLPSPAWAAKNPRRIEFWSDLCNNGDQQSPPVPSPVPAPAPSASPAPVPVHVLDSTTTPTAPPQTSQEQRNRDPTSVTNRVTHPVSNPVTNTHPVSNPVSNPVTSPVTTRLTSNVSQEQQVRRRWLDGYLDDMAGRLRTGGWKEADISEMMVSSSTAAYSADYSDSVSLRTALVPMQTRAAVIQGLVYKVQELSDSLKRSGWSVQDVAEALNTSNLSLWASSHSFTATTPAGYITAR